MSAGPTPFRPCLEDLEEKDFLLDCLRDCWQEDPERRPDFKYIRLQLRPLISGLHSNIFDNMLCIMEKYATRLEWLVEERTRQLSEEKKKIENLLLRMLPKSVTDQLKRGERVVPEQYDCVTIFFSDIVGFTEIAARISPMHIVQLLNELYTIFDSIIGEYDVYKVETIGDAYMVVSGLPIRNGDHHAGEIASMSLHLLSHIKSFKVPYGPNETLRLRIGIHSGPCAAAVVGLKMPRYCLFGDTVNTASRMESTGVALKIHVSHPCKLILDKLEGYRVEERGLTEIKGKGPMLTYFLLNEDKTSRLRRISLARPPGSEGEQDGLKNGGNPETICPPPAPRERPSLSASGAAPVVQTEHRNGRLRHSPANNRPRDFFVNHGLDDTDLSSVELLLPKKGQPAEKLSSEEEKATV